jgi:DNA polymerase III delta prime subunit
LSSIEFASIVVITAISNSSYAYKSVTGRHKIIILDEADSMTTAAQQGELSNNDMI